MTITYPLAVTAFQETLGIQLISFKPSYGMETSGQASGIILVKDIRPALWLANVQTRPFSIDQAAVIEARLESLEGSINTFYMYNSKRRFPLTGQFDDSNVKINTLGSDGKSLSLKGLPAGRTISEGDMLSFAIGARPYYALHRVLQTVVANGSGVTAEFAVNIGILPGSTTNTPVKLNKAFGEFMMSGDWTPTQPDPLSVYYNFSAVQI